MCDHHPSVTKLNETPPLHHLDKKYSQETYAGGVSRDVVGVRSSHDHLIMIIHQDKRNLPMVYIIYLDATIIQVHCKEFPFVGRILASSSRLHSSYSI
jgi:hypothetical protein